MTIGLDRISNCIGQFFEDVRRGVIDNRMNCIQAQSVEVILGQPIKRVLNKEIAHDATGRTIEIDPVSTRRAVPVGEELWRVGPQIISFRAKMVIDNIEQNHDAALMRTLNQLFQILRSSVNAIGSEWKNAVVTPIAPAGKVRNRHQLDRRDSKISEIVEALAHGEESSSRRKSSDMQFINDGFFPSAATPGAIAPIKGLGIDHFAWPMHILRLESRRRGGHFLLSVDTKTILRSGFRRAGREFEPTLVITCERNHHRGTREAKLDLLRRRRAQSKAHASIVAALGSERHAILPFHSTLPFFRFRVVPATRPSIALAKDKVRHRRRFPRSANPLRAKNQSIRSSG